MSTKFNKKLLDTLDQLTPGRIPIELLEAVDWSPSDPRSMSIEYYVTVLAKRISGIEHSGAHMATKFLRARFGIHHTKDLGTIGRIAARHFSLYLKLKAETKHHWVADPRYHRALRKMFTNPTLFAVYHIEADTTFEALAILELHNRGIKLPSGVQTAAMDYLRDSFAYQPNGQPEDFLTTINQVFDVEHPTAQTLPMMVAYGAHVLKSFGFPDNTSRKVILQAIQHNEKGAAVAAKLGKLALTLGGLYRCNKPATDAIRDELVHTYSVKIPLPKCQCALKQLSTSEFCEGACGD